MCTMQCMPQALGPADTRLCLLSCAARQAAKADAWRWQETAQSRLSDLHTCEGKLAGMEVRTHAGAVQLAWMNAAWRGYMTQHAV